MSLPSKLHDHLLDLQPGYATGFKWLPFALGVLYTAGWCALLATLRKNRERPVVAWAATMTMIWGLLGILFVGWIDAGKSYRTMIADMQKSLPANHACVASREIFYLRLHRNGLHLHHYRNGQFHTGLERYRVYG